VAKTSKSTTKHRSNRPNVLLIAIDSLVADHMSCYGYGRLTTPHIDRFAQESVLFEKTYSPHIPTTSAYASMLTGRDCFGTQIVALRHKGQMRPEIRTAAEMFGSEGYNTTCVGFTGNPSARGFKEYIDYSGWGDWSTRPLRKAENLNEVTVPQIEKLSKSSKPWFVMLRHMDPHSPYLPPAPYDRMFYHGNEFDPKNKSMKPVFDFKPFADYFKTWMPPGLTDRHYMDAQYDGAIAYMDACIAVLFEQLRRLDILDNTIVVINGDHGETLYEHECWYDHHGMYDNCLHVPLIIRYPRKWPQGMRIDGYNQHKDLVPTLLDLAGIKVKDKLDGRSLSALVSGKQASFDSEFYITECTWMHKHGWRTPQWKYIEAIEPDFHFMPSVELYNLTEDPLELNNVAKKHPEVVAMLKARMDAHCAKREKQTGLKNPSLTQVNWSGQKDGPFESSQEAYDTQHIGSPKTAQKIQAAHAKKKKSKSSRK